MDAKEPLTTKYGRQAEELQARFGGALDAAPDAIVLVDASGRIALVNLEAERLFGHPRADLLGELVDVLVPSRFHGEHPAHRDGYFRDPMTRPMGSGLELSGRRADGSEFPVEISLSPLSVEGTTLAMAAIRDVTSRKKTEAKFRGLLEAAPDAMVIVNSDGMITLVNSQTELLFGFGREELIGKPIEILVPQRFYKSHVGHRDNFLGDPHRRPMGSGLELSGRRKDGSEFPVEISLSPFDTDEGMLVTAAIRDITERRRLEEVRREVAERQRAEAEVRTLNENLEKRVRERTHALEVENAELALRRTELQNYIDAMSTLNAKVSVDGTLLMVNRAAQDAFGLTPETVVGTSFVGGSWWSFDPDTRARIATALAEAGRGVPVSSEEKIIIAGRVVTVNLTLVPVLGPGGSVESVVVEARDITRRVEVEEALKSINAELEAFTYSVSHDLRAPIRQIDGFSRILSEHLGITIDEKAQHYLRRVQEGAHHMGRLVDDLLQLASLGRQSPRPRLVQLGSIVEDVLAHLQPDIAARVIRWQIGTLPTVECDPGLMKIVFMNLLSNAVKYTQHADQPHIQIGQETRQGRTVIYVRDNGVGFDMKYADKLFGVFQRLHRADEFEGTGVGLATVQRIIRKHGGDIWAEAALGTGATFFFTLGS